ncbi:chemotaxis-specific protein-glutamate methyltransferase CheB [Halostagnicola sp. A-GB9-2]|uniref:chemotaxis-specific protein-glutamate methyltransferase CheB n=1 Tax=Halostagnicola sp. A-GB9-2 TaxID=3048066 RepID=UPI0024C0DDCB|nr:chemotaxis-specific protein-glutamate methyltransferase CheB [Halostagnicola sp. A-GB9-2]MDJ1432393.1 chemotaxis-specific protein-glutamate methyltransferase CheB [Halostagnicola sp. A-GB9-2]
MVTVGIVDDSAFMRNILTEILEQRGHDVVGEASDGESAVELVESTDVEVITMDISMPGQGGHWAVDKIMERHPVPIVVLSAHVHEDADEALELMERGVVDIIRKPGGKERSVSLWDRADEVVERIAGASQSSSRASSSMSTSAGSARGSNAETGTSTRSSASTASDRSSIGSSTRASSSSTTAVDSTRTTTLLIGSSTGGPETVETLLANLPTGLDLRVIVVQHMTDALTGSFADRLDAATEFEFREAGADETITAGEAVLAKGGYHLEVTGYRRGRIDIDLSKAPKINNVRPAVDAMMRTAADVIDDHVIGVILTGMGQDGAVGIQSVADAGGRTIAQDEETSRIFGMPKAAIETGSIEQVLAIEDIPEAIVDLCTDEN